MRHRRLLSPSLLSVTAVVSAFALLATGCAGGDEAEPEAHDSLRHQPTAPATPEPLAPEEIDTSWFTDVWLDDAYSNGIEGPLEVTGTLCGIVDGIAVSVAEGDGKNPTPMHGTDLATGEHIWSKTLQDCDPLATANDTVIGTRHTSISDPPMLVSIDPRTGETTDITSTPDPYRVDVFTVIDDVVYLMAGEHVLAVDIDGTELWTASGFETDDCTYADTYIGCLTYDDEVVTIDSATGEVLLEGFEVGDDVMWLTDGFTKRYPELPLTPDTVMEIFSIEGEPIGERAYRPWLPCPDQSEKAVFPLEAFSPEVACIMPNGEPAVVNVEGVFTHLTTGHEFGQGMPQSITADGSTVLMNEFGMTPYLVLPDSDEPIVIGDAESNLSVVEGWLVDDRVFAEDVTLIYLPAD